MQYLTVEYVGPKPQEVDNVANTGFVWIGKGDRHDVPASAWDIMKRHPDVFALVGPAPTSAGLADADSPEIIALRAENAQLKADLQTLREHIESLGKDSAPDSKPAEIPPKPENWDALTAAELKTWAKTAGKKIDGRLSADAMRLALA